MTLLPHVIEKCIVCSDWCTIGCCEGIPNCFASTTPHTHLHTTEDSCLFSSCFAYDWFLILISILTSICWSFWASTAELLLFLISTFWPIFVSARSSQCPLEQTDWSDPFVCWRRFWSWFWGQKCICWFSHSLSFASSPLSSVVASCSRFRFSEAHEQCSWSWICKRETSTWTWTESGKFPFPFLVLLFSSSLSTSFSCKSECIDRVSRIDSTRSGSSQPSTDSFCWFWAWTWIWFSVSATSLSPLPPVDCFWASGPISLCSSTFYWPFEEISWTTWAWKSCSSHRQSRTSAERPIAETLTVY